VSGLRVFESPLVFRLEFVSGEDNFYADYFHFESETAVDGTSWGTIKSLFR